MPARIASIAAGPFAAAVPNAAATGGSVMANALDRQYRAGLVAKLTWTAGRNTVVLGDWFDYANEADVGSYSGLSAGGLPADLWGDETGQMLRLKLARRVGVGEGRLPRLLRRGADRGRAAWDRWMGGWMGGWGWDGRMGWLTRVTAGRGHRERVREGAEPGQRSRDVDGLGRATQRCGGRRTWARW